MAQDFKLSEKEREILIDILNEPVFDGYDYCEAGKRIAALFNMNLRFFADAFETAVGDVNEEINIRRN
jgi:hypothetical protein